MTARGGRWQDLAREIADWHERAAYVGEGEIQFHVRAAHNIRLLARTTDELEAFADISLRRIEELIVEKSKKPS